MLMDKRIKRFYQSFKETDTDLDEDILKNTLFF